MEKKFVSAGTLMKRMWELVMFNALNSDTVLGKRKTVANLENLLQEDGAKHAIEEDDHSWALLALDKALNPKD
jgi:hypothetical protein